MKLELYKDRFRLYEWSPGHFYVYDTTVSNEKPIGFSGEPDFPLSSPSLSVAHSLCNKILRKESA